METLDWTFISSDCDSSLRIDRDQHHATNTTIIAQPYRTSHPNPPLHCAPAPPLGRHMHLPHSTLYQCRPQGFYLCDGRGTNGEFKPHFLIPHWRNTLHPAWCLEARKNLSLAGNAVEGGVLPMVEAGFTRGPRVVSPIHTLAPATVSSPSKGAVLADVDP